MFHLARLWCVVFSLAVAGAPHVWANADGFRSAAALDGGGLRSTGLSAGGTDEQLMPTGTVVTSDTDRMVAAIRKATDENRDSVLKQVSENLDATEAMMATARRNSQDMKSNPRTRFNAAYDEARARASEVRKTLRDARHALPDEIPSAQDRLATAYETFAHAVEKVQSTGRGGPSASAEAAR